jgi:hypothetical protein
MVDGGYPMTFDVHYGYVEIAANSDLTNGRSSGTLVFWSRYVMRHVKLVYIELLYINIIQLCIYNLIVFIHMCFIYAVARFYKMYLTTDTE